MFGSLLINFHCMLKRAGHLTYRLAWPGLVGLALVVWGGGCASFRGLELDLSITSGPSLRLVTSITAGQDTNSLAKASSK